MLATQVSSSYEDDLAFALEFLNLKRRTTAVSDRVDAEPDMVRDEALVDVSNDVLKSRIALLKEAVFCYTALADARSKLVARFSGHLDTSLAGNQRRLSGEMRPVAFGAVNGYVASRLQRLTLAMPGCLASSATICLSQFPKVATAAIGRRARSQRVPRLGPLGRVEFVEAEADECCEYGSTP